MTDYLTQALESLYDQQDVTSAGVLAAVVTVFNREFHKNLDASKLDAAEREQLREYLGPSGSPLHYDKKVPAHLPLYGTTAAKINWLCGTLCPVCPEGAEFSPENFPIEIPPWSHQCAREVGPALRSAINSSPFYCEHFKGRVASGPICLRIVFILGEDARIKDCDNMAKGLVDAFQGLLYANDKQIEHLDLMKVHSSPGASSGYILMRIMSTVVNDHSNVLVPKHARIAWMTAEDLQIDRFLSPPKLRRSSCAVILPLSLDKRHIRPNVTFQAHYR